MTLGKLIWQQHRLALLKVIGLNLLNALVNVAIIAFINRFLIGNISHTTDLTATSDWQILGIFLLGIGLLLLTTFYSQLTLTKLGHGFVLELRATLIKRIMDTQFAQIERIGSAKLLASLSTDIQSITVAFVRLPELVQGVIICGATAVYLGWLSLPMLAVVSVCIAMTVWVSSRLVRQVYTHLSQLREVSDALYQDYQAVIDGHKELTLNRHRAKHLYDMTLHSHAQQYLHYIVKSDTYHLSAVSWSNIMMFAVIGLVFVLAHIGHWVDVSVATTFALTILFLQSPLLKAIGAYPTLQAAQVALEKIQSLQLADYQPDFTTPHLNPNWQRLDFKNIDYHYASGSNFSLKNTDFSLQRGEVIFLIGANGSGKSTLAKLLTGLYLPSKGQIMVDGQPITSHNLVAYQQLFSAIYSDFYLFKNVMGKGETEPNSELVQNWLKILAIKDKVTLTDNQFSTTELSQGQRKRLAMLLAVAEQKPILLLDEWAADQDPAFRRVFYHDIVPLLQQMGKTLFIISHDDGYFTQADRLFEMRQGQLTELTGIRREQATQDAIAHLESEQAMTVTDG